jgi:ankyrin repeat protein
MKKLIANYLMIFLVASMAAAYAMDKPAESKSIFSKIKSSFKLTPEEATQKLRALIDKKSEDITFKKVEPLVAAGANIEVQSSQGKTILIRAVEEDNSPLVAFLLKNGADAKVGALLAKAALNGSAPIVKQLIKAGADINEKDNNFTALYYATDILKPELVGMLLDAGANPNIQAPETGNTPLHAISEERQYRVYSPEKRDEIISLLVANGADVTIANKRGKTPAMLLRGTKQEALLKIPQNVKYDETSLKLLEQMQKGKGRK